MNAIEYSKEEHASFVSELVQHVSNTTHIKISYEKMISLWFSFYSIRGAMSVATIEQIPDGGRLIFLEQGNDSSGLYHIRVRHTQEFLRKGIAEPREAVSRSILAGPSAEISAENRCKILAAIYSDGGNEIYVAVCLGSNGYIVTSYPIESKFFYDTLRKHSVYLGNTDLRDTEDLQEAVRSSPSKEKWDGSLSKQADGTCSPGEQKEQVWLMVPDFPLILVSSAGSEFYEPTIWNVFQDRVTPSLFKALEELECLIWSSAQKRLSDETELPEELLSATISMRLFAAGYLLSKEFNEKVYVEFDSKYIEARGATLRAAERVIFQSLAASGREASRVEGFGDIELSSSNNGGSSSSPNKYDVKQRLVR